MSDIELFCIITGIGIICGGITLKVYPPKKYLQWGQGVRFPSALRNENTWKEANRFIAKPLIYTGFGFIALSVISIISKNYELSLRTVSLISIMVSVMLVAFTNKHLDRLFDKDVNPRS